MKTIESNQNFIQKGNKSEKFNRFSIICNSIRAISIIFIILFHIGDWFTILRNNLPIYIVIILDFGNIGLDFFVFLSGMLLTVNIIHRGIEKHKWSDWYKKRILRIYPAYWLMLIIIIVFDFLSGSIIYKFHEVLINLSGLQELPIISNTNFHDIHFIFWFLTIILLCYIIYPIIFYGIKKNFKITTIIIIVLFILYVFYPDMYTQPARPLEKIFHVTIYINTYMSFFSRFFEFFFGALFGFWISKENMKNLERILGNRTGIILFAFLVSIFIFFTFYYLTYPNYRWIFPFITFLSIPFLIYIFNKFFKSNTYLNFLGKTSYEIFLCHFFIYLVVYFFIYLIFNNIFSIKLLFQSKLNISLIVLSLFIPLSFYFAYLLNEMFNIILKKQKYYPFFILIALSFLLFTLIALFINFQMKLYISIPIYTSIGLILFYLYKKIGLGKNTSNELTQLKSI